VRTAVRRDPGIAGLLLAFGLLLAIAFSFLGPVRSGSNWTDVDSLFYEAQKLEVQGEPQAKALHQVFTSDIARESAPRGSPRWLNWWTSYNAVYFRRRWTVPAMAAAADPIFGIDSLEEVSLLGWALLAPFLYLLLRRRFTSGASVASTVFCMLLPPLVMWARAPMTDSWAVTMLVVCLLLALLTRDDLRWLPAWILAVLIGSFTRDLALVLLAATGWLAFRERSRRMALVTFAGLLASIPAPLVFPTPLRQTLTIAIEPQVGTRSWGWILERLPHTILNDVLKADATYPFHVAAPYALLAFLMVVPVIAGLVLLFSRSGRDPYLTFMRAAAVGGVATILVGGINSDLRHELVLVPVIAAGLALLAERLLPLLRGGVARRAGYAAGSP
jgi:hypothetical protein